MIFPRILTCNAFTRALRTMTLAAALLLAGCGDAVAPGGTFDGPDGPGDNPESPENPGGDGGGPTLDGGGSDTGGDDDGDDGAGNDDAGNDGNEGPPPTPGSLEDRLNDLGVDTDRDPRLDTDGNEIPETWGPFGSSWQPTRIGELFLGGMQPEDGILLEDVGENFKNRQHPNVPSERRLAIPSAATPIGIGRPAHRIATTRAATQPTDN